MAFFDRQINFMGISRYAFAFSAVLMAACLATLYFRGLNFGLDFTGGTVVELAFEAPVSSDAVRQELDECGFNGAVVQTFGTDRDLLIRVPPQNAEAQNAVAQGPCADADEAVTTTGQSAGGDSEDDFGLLISNALRSQLDTPFELRRSEFVGPAVGEELREQGLLALLASLGLVLVYVLFRFTARLAVGAIVALMHDPIMVLGFFSFTGREFDLSVLAALLAVIGYSINDSIVIADRIRENFRVLRGQDAYGVVNVSINQTLDRTIMTSFTTLLTMLALILFGGEMIKGFAIALVVGIVVGTYSSIYVSATLALLLGLSREDLLVPQKEAFDDGKP